jgi:cellulose synthase (UDP-forming)
LAIAASSTSAACRSAAAMAARVSLRSVRIATQRRAPSGAPPGAPPGAPSGTSGEASRVQTVESRIGTREPSGRWKSIYVPQRLSFGLTPADLHSYFKQQLKWSTGMFGVFFSHYFRHFRDLTLPQKVHYFFAGTYYLEGPAIAVTCILPIVFLFFGLWAVEMNFGEFLIHISPFVIMSILIGWFVQRWYRDRSEKGFLWRGMFLKKGTWPIYVLGLAYCLTRTRVPYLPTPKIADRNVYTSLVVPHLTIMGFSAAAIVYALLSYDRFVIGTRLMILFAACNIVLMLPTVLVAHAPWFDRRKRAGAAQ